MATASILITAHSVPVVEQQQKSSSRMPMKHFISYTADKYKIKSYPIQSKTLRN
jgi:hypothetical protein